MEIAEAVRQLQDEYKVQFRKTIGESDVYLFAGITGDLHGNHTDEDYMSKTRYGGRIAHGALMVGYMSTTSTMMCHKLQSRLPGAVIVSYGYDRVRFTGAAFIDDTIIVDYETDQWDLEMGKIFSKVHVTKTDGTLVAVATHILKIVEVN